MSEEQGAGLVFQQHRTRPVFLTSVGCSWEWELTYPNADYPAMEGSLTEFYMRQLVGRRLADACQHVMEELVSECLPSVARQVGASGTIAKLLLRVPESGEKAVLEVNCRNLLESGANPNDLEFEHNRLSVAIIEGYSQSHTFEKVCDHQFTKL